MPPASPAFDLLTDIACGGEGEVRQPYGFPAVIFAAFDIFPLPRPMHVTARQRGLFTIWSGRSVCSI